MAIASRLPHSLAPSVAEPGAMERRALWIATAYVAIMFGWHCFWSHSMAERSVDEAYFENCLWNATHGNGLRTWVEGVVGGFRLHLALHFSPFLYVFVPIYRVFPSMHALHLAVAVGAGAAGVVFYRLARRSLDPGASTLLLGAFLLNPTIILQTFMDFHEQALAILPLMMLVTCYRNRSLLWMLFWSVILMSMREDNALVVIGFGVFAWFHGRDRRLSAALLLVTAAWLGAYAWLGVHVLGGGKVSHLFEATYGGWGSTPREALRAMVTHPQWVVRHLFAKTPIGYLAQLLVPFLGVLGFGDALVLIMLPSLFLILLAGHEMRLFQIRTHYSIVPVVFLFIGAIGTLTHWRTRTVVVAGRRLPAATVMAAAMLLVSVMLAPFWIVRAIGRLNPNVPAVRAVMAMVPDTASVTAPAYMLVHMANRRHIAPSWNGPLTTTEYVILEDKNKLFFRGTSLDIPYSPRAAEILEQAHYVRIYDSNGWHVWRGTPVPYP